MSNFVTKRRLISLASASAMIATMALAAVPASTMAATCTPTGFNRDGINLTAARIGGTVTGDLDATTCDIGVYNPDKVANADIHGARYYGVVVNGGTVNTTGSEIHQIGDSPFDGMQRGRAILYINGANGTISGNKVYDFQKNGIEVRGLTADGGAPSATKTSATIANNVVTGRGHIGEIAQNGIVVMGNAGATVRDNTVSGLFYTGPADTYATGLLNVDVAASRIVLSGNKIDAQVRIDGDVFTVANVRGSSTTTVRPHGVRVDLRSVEQPENTVLGKKLAWKITVDGRVNFETKQNFADHDVFRRTFATGSGKHVVKVFKNDVLVRTVSIRA